MKYVLLFSIYLASLGVVFGDAQAVKIDTVNTPPAGYVPISNGTPNNNGNPCYAWGPVSAASATWGSITGTLSSQTDLQNALNAKLSLTGNGSGLTGLTWAQLGSTPTTIAGYGITDAYTKTASDAKYALLAGPFPWADISGTPTTLAGYGITDAYTKTASDGKYALQATTVNGHALSSNVTVTTGDLGATTVGSNFFTLTNPSAVSWARINADNSITTRTAAQTLADLGGISGNQMITLSGAVTGSGATSITTTLANSIVGLSNLTATGTPSSSTYLRGDNSWATVPAGFTNPMTTLGDLIYENATPAAARLAGNTATANKFLAQTGTGSISAAPSWFDLFNTANTFNAAQTISPNGSNVTDLTITDASTGNFVFQNVFAGSPELSIQTGGSSNSSQGAYFNILGNLEAVFELGASDNGSGQKYVRFSNTANRFALADLNDSQIITGTPFSIANSSPSNSFYMLSTGAVLFGSATDNASGAVLQVTGGISSSTVTTGSMVKTDANHKFVAAVSGTDFAPPTSGSSILYGNSSGGFSNATIGSGLSFSGGSLTATGSGGTVTTFSAGNLSPLFTSSVATATTTPALTFSLTTAAANTIFGNATGSTAAPSYTATSSYQGTTATTFAAGNDTRFPASVTGLRKGAGAGSADTAATAGTDYVIPSGNITGNATHDGSGNTITTTYAPLASPALTGAPTAPTQTAADNSTKIATDAFVLANSVQSVGLSVPGLLYTVSGSPVTGSGTLTESLKTQTANFFLAGPLSGSSANPTFRGIADADIPRTAGSASISAAGNTNLSSTGLVNSYTATFSAGSGAYTQTFSLVDAGATAGDIYLINVNFPASTNPLVQAYDNSTGGTLINSIASTGTAGGTTLEYQYNGTAWVKYGKGALLLMNNGSDIPSASTFRTNLGLGTLATQSGTFSGTSSGTNTGDQTAGTGLTLTSGAFSVNTSQNIATLSNLTTDGMLYTTGGTGALNAGWTFAPDSVSTSTGTAVSISGGASSNATGTGGSITIKSGAGTGTNGNSGAINIVQGTPTGTGTYGVINIGTLSSNPVQTINIGGGSPSGNTIINLDGPVVGAQSIQAVTGITLGFTSNVVFFSRSRIASPADGKIELLNNAQTGFTSLQFGGTTSSFPEIKVNGAAFNFRLADDSADCAITASTIGASGDVTVTGGNIIAATAGKGLQVKGGTNARVGTGTLVAGTVTISNTSVTANSRIFLQDTSTSITNVGVLTVSAVSAGTSFTVTSTLALDTSTFSYFIVEQN